MPWRTPFPATGPIRLDPPSPHDQGSAFSPEAPSALDLEFDDGSWGRVDGASDSLDPAPLSFR